MAHMKWSVEKLALPLFIVIVAAIAIPLAYVVRTRLDVERGNGTDAVPIAEEPQSPPAPGGDDGDSRSIDEISCRGAGGRWNPCGSACRGAPSGTACIQVCVPQCECGGIAGFGCPDGFACGDFEPPGAADAMGICTARAR